MRTSTRIIVFLTAMSLGALSGCYESMEVTLHEPAEYKGPEDPLLAKQRSPEQQAQLRERFERVQTDR
ncbi:hypothetical protein Nhal_1617 [Nitrosococcus halophilus Nc 4]|uniref:Lipoprotein n=1 Tax=Nitrosococcus halophilus (strain Nc4) TaxID=472759 RepID=D5C1W8_NITHN|nr:hypothetical protein [Nitrosococcus halophilus]ADE14751.1 hypothetical protein Nhal_1617 [Nitrosococcus halophilus Nc 4]